MAEIQKTKSSKNTSYIWGALLIFAGVLSLIGNYIELKDDSWALPFAGAGVLALGLYLLDRSRLVNLLPSYILFGVAGLIYFATNDILQNGFIAIFILSVIAVPFVIGYFTDKNNWGLLIPAYVLFVVSGIILIAEGNLVSEDFIPTYLLSAIALPFLIGYARSRNKGLLIPAYVLLAVGIMILLIIRDVLDGLLIPSYVMFTIALPFVWAYYQNRENKGYLIPAVITGAIGTAFLLFNESMIQYVLPGILILAGVVLIVRNLRDGAGKTAP